MVLLAMIELCGDKPSTKRLDQLLRGYVEEGWVDQTLFSNASGFSWKFVGKSKPTIYYPPSQRKTE
jgi:hypothetical protein